MQQAQQTLIDGFIQQATSIAPLNDPTPDENIVFTTGALLYHGLTPADFCGGHLSRKTGGPYIDIEFPNYADFLRVYSLLTTASKKDAHQRLIAHQVALLQLGLLKHLNAFYATRTVTYETQLCLVPQPDYRLRLQAIATPVIDTLASHHKRKTWLIAVNKEFFDFGAYLFTLKP